MMNWKSRPLSAERWGSDSRNLKLVTHNAYLLKVTLRNQGYFFSVELRVKGVEIKYLSTSQNP